jgi:hypothetical protein
MFQNIAADDIVDEHADGRKSCREKCRAGFQSRVKIDEVVSMTGIQLIEQRALVVPRAEHCDPHLRTLQDSVQMQDYDYTIIFVAAAAMNVCPRIAWFAAWRSSHRFRSGLVGGGGNRL